LNYFPERFWQHSSQYLKKHEKDSIHINNLDGIVYPDISKPIRRIPEINAIYFSGKEQGHRLAETFESAVFYTAKVERPNQCPSFNKSPSPFISGEGGLSRAGNRN